MSLVDKELDLLEFYREIEGVSKKGTWYYSVAHDHFYFSEMCSKLLNVEYGKFFSREESDKLLRQSDVSIVRNVIDTCLASAKPIETDVFLREREGQSPLVHLLALPIVEDGKVVRVVGSLQEVQSQRIGVKAAEHLDTMAHQYQNVVDQYAIVAFTDRNGLITEVNDLFCEISQYSREELIGKSHQLVNSGVHPKEFFGKIWDNITNGKTWKGEICNMKKNGDFYWVETYISPIYEGDEISGFMAIRFDISDKKLLQEEIKEERDRATFSAQLASIGELSVSVAHEINNPLAVISGMNSILPNVSDGNEKIGNISTKIEVAVSRIKKITDNLRKYGRKSKQSDFEVLELSQVISGSLEFIQASLNKQDIALTIEPIPENVFIKCREIEISQTLINLVNNARDAIKELDDKWIRLNVEVNQDEVALYVTDSGYGIPEHIQHKIMQSFFTTKKVGEGTGLGLSLAKRFIEEHGGSIRIDNSSENTCFEIKLPIAQPETEVA